MILALETSSATASAAVVDAAGRPLGESRPAAGALQARRLLECVHEALTAAGVSLGDIETVVCGLGPGTFTGLRIGVATARALAQAADLSLGGVPSLEALARGLAASAAATSAAATSAAATSADCVVPLIDGRRSEVFAAVYRRVPPQTGQASETDRVFDTDRVSQPDPVPAQPSSWPDLELVEPLTIVAVEALAEFLGRWPAAVVGGDGALLHDDRLPPVVTFERAVAAPSALMVARTFLAGSAALTRGFAATLPIYGREPDALPRSPAAAAQAALHPIDRPRR